MRFDHVAAVGTVAPALGEEQQQHQEDGVVIAFVYLRVHSGKRRKRVKNKLFLHHFLVFSSDALNYLTFNFFLIYLWVRNMSGLGNAGTEKENRLSVFHKFFLSKGDFTSLFQRHRVFPFMSLYFRCHRKRRLVYLLPNVSCAVVDVMLEPVNVGDSNIEAGSVLVGDVSKRNTHT